MQLRSGQVAVVTGGASGIGLHLATEFVARGMHVVLGDVEHDALDDAVAALKSSGGSAIGVLTDVAKAEQVDALAAATMHEFGRVDIICNNAGVVTVGPRIWEAPASDWEWVLGVNLGGVVNGIRAFVPLLVDQGVGHVVNTASMAGISTAPRQGPYTVSKHAVVALSEALAVELADAGLDIGVTIVCPGIIETNMQQSDRNRPNDLAGPGFALTEADVHGLAAWASMISGPSMPPHEAAAQVVDTIESNRLFVAPNGRIEGARARVDRLLGDLGVSAS